MHGSVTYFGDDESAQRFLRMSLPCYGSLSISLQGFLNGRADQARHLGVKQRYRVVSSMDDGAHVIGVEEYTSKTNGEPLPGFPRMKVFTYLSEGPSARFVGADQAGGDQYDPMTFMRLHSAAACEMARAVSTIPEEGS